MDQTRVVKHMHTKRSSVYEAYLNIRLLFKKLSLQATVMQHIGQCNSGMTNFGKKREMIIAHPEKQMMSFSLLSDHSKANILQIDPFTHKYTNP